MKLIFLSCLLVLGGCATKYVAPSDPLTTATLTVVHLSWFDPSGTRVTAINNPECNITSGFGRLSDLRKAHGVADEPQSIRIIAGQPLFLAVTGSTRGNYVNMGMGGYTDYTCTNLIAFTPKVGGKYTISQNLTAVNECVSKVVESDSGALAPNLRAYPVTGACRGL